MLAKYYKNLNQITVNIIMSKLLFIYKLNLKFVYFYHNYSFPSCFAFITKLVLIYF